MLLITFIHKGLNSILTEFKVDMIKCLGGVHSNTTSQKGEKWAKFVCVLKSKRPTSCWFEVMTSRNFFCTSGHVTCSLNFIHLRQTKPKGGSLLKVSRGGTIEPFLMRLQSLVSFWASLGLQKGDSLWATIRRRIWAIPIGSFHANPNNSNRALTRFVLGP